MILALIGNRKVRREGRHLPPMNSIERRAVAALSSVLGLRMFGLFLILPVLALYAGEIDGATPAMIGVALGAYGLTQALFQVPFGLLSDRFGRKPLLVAGLLLFALGSVIAARANSIEVVILGRALQGSGAIASVVLALHADLTREEHRSKAVALVGAEGVLGGQLSVVAGHARGDVERTAGAPFAEIFGARISVIAFLITGAAISGGVGTVAV